MPTSNFFDQKIDTPTPSEPPQADVPAIEGLVQYHPSREDKAATFNALVDIVAIHGLATQAPRTWMAFINGKDDVDGSVNWLSDPNMLPSVVPDSRILSYNWSAYYTGKSASPDSFIQHADNLLCALHVDREMTKRSQRPIIFVCSCFGGLLLAKILPRAIWPAHPRKAWYRPIANYTVGVVFLGTPFRGSWDFGLINANAIIEAAKKINDEFHRILIQYLRPKAREDGGSSPLDELIQTFTEMVNDPEFKFKVVCFYETEKQKYKPYLDKLKGKDGLGIVGFDNVTGHAVVVPEASAVLDGSERVGLDVKHNLLSKHNSNKASGFLAISARIKDLADNAESCLEKRSEEQQSATFTLPKRFSEFIDLDYSTQNQEDLYAKMSPGTCSDLLKSPDYLEWRDSEASSTLICEGKPGAGKSIFASAVINSLQVLKKGKGGGLAYIYLDYTTTNTDKGHKQDNDLVFLLRSILKQLLSAALFIPEETIRLYHDLKIWNRQPNVEESKEHIRLVLRTFPGKSFLIIDALDESDQVVAANLLDDLAAIQSNTRLGIMVTSRPNEDIARAFHPMPVFRLNRFGVREDIEMFVQASIGQTSLFLRKHASEELQRDIVDTISKASEGMFELARLHLGSLADYRNSEAIRKALRELRQAGEFLPLADTDRITLLYKEAYGKTVRMINSKCEDHRKLAKKTLVWILYSMAPLTPEELLHAVAIETESTSPGVYRSVLKDEVSDIQYLIEMCAGLFKVENRRAKLAHYTTAQFLANNIDLIYEEAADMDPQVPIKDKQIRSLALACITYLGLDEFGTENCSDDLRRYNFPFHAHAAALFLSYAEYLDINQDLVAKSVLTSFCDNEQKTRNAAEAIVDFLQPLQDLAIPPDFDSCLSLMKVYKSLVDSRLTSITELRTVLVGQRNTAQDQYFSKVWSIAVRESNTNIYPGRKAVQFGFIYSKDHDPKVQERGTREKFKNGIQARLDGIPENHPVAMNTQITLTQFFKVFEFFRIFPSTLASIHGGIAR